eukprot:5281775-Prymnesium_polylepis.1
MQKARPAPPPAPRRLAHVLGRARDGSLHSRSKGGQDGTQIHTVKPSQNVRETCAKCANATNRAKRCAKRAKRSVQESCVRLVAKRLLSRETSAMCESASHLSGRPYS